MSNEILKKNQDIAEIFKKEIKLTCSPVAIKFIDEIPKKIPLIDEKMRHCEMIRKASYGDKFYSTLEEQVCKGGAGALGLCDMSSKLVNGEVYYNLGRFVSMEIAKDTVKELSVIPEKHLGLIYSPLEKADFEPDVVVIISEPVAAMRISQALVYSDGDKICPSFAGIQSLCGDVTANPIINKNVNITMGCDGSRKEADVKDNELAIGIPKNKINQIVENLMKIG